MGFSFKRFFSFSEKDFDYSTIAVDMHSHLIPGIDDGVKTVEEAVALITELYSLGFRELITTPHIMGDFYKNTPEIINQGLRQVKEAIKNAEIDINIEAAAEYYLDDTFVKKIETEKLLTFGNNYLLLEISYINCPDNFKEIISKAQALNYKIVLAHPERYPFWYHNFEEYKKLKELGIYLQININSLTGYYSPAAKKIAEKLIDNNMVSFVGSDLHNKKHLDLLKYNTNKKYLRKLISLGTLLNQGL